MCAAAAIGLSAVSMTLLSATGASASPWARYIQEGSTGTGVRCVQEALNVWDGAGLVVDGIDGPRTTRAVENFQSREGLAVDGIVGPNTGDLIYDIDYYYVSYPSPGNCYANVPTSY